MHDTSRSGSEAAPIGEAYLGLRNVSLDVPVFVQQDREIRSWTQSLLSATLRRPRREYRTILSDITFEAWPGDRIGLIGRNGAGKTTLLHILTGAYVPTVGEYGCVGQRQALINISLGFNQEATVRENVILRGTAMGVGFAELVELTDSILEFADLKGVANQRLATLSAGQRLRLGFSISTSVQHDIMLLDEWIGAGDAEFLTKARNRMLERVEASKIMVLATHSNDLIKRVCNRGIVLEKGRIEFMGDIGDALDHYQEMIAGPRTRSAPEQAKAAKVTPRPIRRKLHGGFTVDFPHHVQFENQLPDAETGGSRYSVLLEYIDIDAHDAFNRLHAAATAIGATDVEFESVVPTLKATFSDARGPRLIVSVQNNVPPDSLTVANSRGRIHLTLVTPGPDDTR